MSEWYYDKNGSRVGPLTREIIEGLYSSGSIGERTLVWNKDVSPNWISYHEAIIARSNPDSPPPLPAGNVNSSFAWVFALVPLIGMVIENTIAQLRGKPPSDEPQVFIAYALAYTFLGLLDARQIAKSGRNKKSVTLAPLVWLAPMYLIQRARALGQRQFLFLVWLLAFVSAILYQSPEILSGNVYFGAGIPRCDAGITIRNVKDAFGTIPRNKIFGISALEIKDIKEVLSTEKITSCSAFVKTTTAAEIPIIYEITPKDGKFYFQVQIQD